MKYIKTASSATLRSYSSDLGQAFGMEFEENSGAKKHRVIQGPPSRLNESELLRICREAQLRWAPLSPSSRNRKAACLKSFLGWLHKERATDRDLSLQIHAPKVPQRLPHFLSFDEAKAVVDSLKSDLRNAETQERADLCQRDLALILLLYGGGLRVSEACLLRWADVESGGKILRIKGKGGRERLAALPPVAQAAVEALRRPSLPYVFGTEPLSTRKAYDIVRSRGAAAGLLKPLHPHALRHSYATHLLSDGANLRTLQELLGHSSLQATQRYTHVSLDQLGETLEKLHPLGQVPKKPARR